MNIRDFMASTQRALDEGKKYIAFTRSEAEFLMEVLKSHPLRHADDAEMNKFLSEQEK